MDTPTSVTEFEVFQFSLVSDAVSRPTQATRTCGLFGSIEQAFCAARWGAIREFSRLQRAALEAAETAAVELIDTEWGYDIRKGHLVVTRFWVHERFPTATT